MAIVRLVVGFGKRIPDSTGRGPRLGLTRTWDRKPSITGNSYHMSSSISGTRMRRRPSCHEISCKGSWR